MQTYKQRFIELAIRCEVLRFGEFTLKSGRVSPYFFNAGQFNTGRALAELGRCYAQCLVDNHLDFDVLFGPAYKGIPLVAAIACALAEQHGIDKPFAFNRKEVKSHGEGGRLVGARLHGRTLIVDDVITAGTAIREAVGLIASQSAGIAGVLVALDRQERGQGELSAIQEIERDFGIAVTSIICLTDLIDYLGRSPDYAPHLDAMTAYRQRYGIA